jgi:hypothetical protein
MQINATQFQVDKVIVHEVPRRKVGDPKASLTLSQVESPLTPSLKAYFRDKVCDSLSASGSAVVFDGGSTSLVPPLVLDNLGPQKTNFVKMSRDLANHLYLIQTGVNSGGLLIVIQGRLAGKRCLAVLKIEKENGARAHQQQLKGMLTYSTEQPHVDAKDEDLQSGIICAD